MAGRDGSSLDEALKLPPHKLIEWFVQSGDPWPPLKLLLRRVIENDFPLPQGVDLGAAVLARCSIGPESLEPLSTLLHLIHVDPRLPDGSSGLRGAIENLERLEKRLESTDAIADKSRTSRAGVEIDRLRAILVLYAGDIEKARALLVEVQRQCKKFGESRWSVNLAVDLSNLEWRHRGNWGVSVEYAIQSADLLTEIGSGLADELTWSVLSNLMQLAGILWYQQAQAQSAIRLASRVVESLPNEAGAWKILGNAHAQDENFAESARAFERLVALDPDEKLGSRGNLAAALTNLKREADALTALTESIRLRPNNWRTLSMRAQLRERMGDLQEAAHDFELTIEILEANRPADSDQDRVQRNAYREHWKIWALSYRRLLSLYESRGNVEKLTDVIERLKRTGDDYLSALGHKLSGDVARRSGRFADARREYDLALDAFPHDTDARVARALLAADARDVNAAVADLSLLTSRDANPDAAIQALNSLAARFPEDLRIQRWRGFAHFEVGDFERAEADLDAYLVTNPGDIEARRWLGLSLISADPDAHEPEKDRLRCFRGVKELAKAAVQADPESRRSLIWVVDRLLLKFGFIQFFLTQEPTVREAIPGLDRLIERLEPALMGGREYAARALAFSECIDLARQLELPCYGTYLLALLADIELLLGRTQSALEHVRAASNLRATVMRPRSLDLSARHDAAVSDDPLRNSLELEHTHIYQIAAESLVQVANTSARIAAAAGMKPEQVRMADIESTLRYVRSIPAIEAVAIAQTLRNLGRTDDALRVLDEAMKAENGTPDEVTRGHLLFTRGTVLAEQGNLPEAARAMGEAEHLIEEERRWLAWMNLASYLLTSEEFESALDCLAQFNLEQVARTDEDKFKYHCMRAEALAGQGRIEAARRDHKGAEGHLGEALESVRQAIGALESTRGALEDLELRSSWAAQRQTVRAFALGVQIAADLRQSEVAFDFAERSRSRLFVDEMALGRGAYDAERLELEQQIQTLERKNAILDGLAQGGERGELLTQLRQLDPKLDVLTLDENGAEQLSADQLRHAVGATVYKLKRLRERVAAHRLRTARSRYGEIVTFEACRDLLSELEDTVLLEFVVQETDTLIFLVRSEDQQPRMVRTLHNVDVSEWSRAIVQRLSDLTFPDNETWPDQALLAEFFELVEEHIRPEQTICIVPHGPLHRIPFHALRLGGQYLIDRNPIVYAPSASVLAHVVGQSQEEFSHTAVVVGDTREDLPYAQDEARQVARLLSVDATPRSQATRIKLLESIAAARNPRILHIACHGYFDTEDALSSGILAADDDELGNPAILSARDLLDVQFRADLVALSACQSGLSDVAAGDELMGLNRALLIGGTRCVLGSLWRVDDSSTSLLMRYFYEAWLAAGPQREPMSKSRALRFAQRRVRDLKRRDLDAAKEAGLLGSVRDFSAEPTSTQSRPKPDDRVFISVAHWASFALVGDFR